MRSHPTRRSFLRNAAATGAAAGLADWIGLFPIGRTPAARANVTPDLVRFSPELEPVVRLIEVTPREQCVAAVVEQLRQGLPYRHLLAALYLAAIRAALWHGSGVHGFDHNAYVVHSAHQLSLDLPVAMRLLPAFHALDNFKGMQQAYSNRRGLPALTGVLPTADRAEGEFHASLRAWEPNR